MAVDFTQNTLKKYLDQLASREPVPGGGSASALTAALGLGLISMVAQYSIGRKSNNKSQEARLKKVLNVSEDMRNRLLYLTSEDARAYLGVVAARSKDLKSQKRATRQAASVGKEVCRICYKALDLTGVLVADGNPYLISDVEVAVELLQAAFLGSMVMVRVNK